MQAPSAERQGCLSHRVPGSSTNKYCRKQQYSMFTAKVYIAYLVLVSQLCLITEGA